ncbi:hypothetical protein Tco_1275789 [Tanacetum coccineum]
MDEAIQVSCIIDKLPPSWKDFKHTLKHKKEDLTLVELGSHLRIEESLKVQDNDNPKSNNVVGPYNQMFRLNIDNDNIALAFMSTCKLNDSILWHARLGHDEALDKFNVFKTKVELQQGSQIKRFRTDRGGDSSTGVRRHQQKKRRQERLGPKNVASMSKSHEPDRDQNPESLEEKIRRVRRCSGRLEKGVLHSHVKMYDGSEDPEDHLKIFQAAAKVERWAMPTWCHMFNSTLTGYARVWFDDLLPESIDSVKRIENEAKTVRCTVAVRGGRHVSTRYCSGGGWTNQSVTRGTGVCQYEVCVCQYEVRRVWIRANHEAVGGVKMTNIPLDPAISLDEDLKGRNCPHLLGAI